MYLLPHLLWIDSDGVWVGQEHLWSDWPWHIAMMRQLAEGTWTHPLIAGEPLRYPFAMALLSAGLLKLGASIQHAFLLPILPLWFLLLAGMHKFWTQHFKNPWLALLPIFLFFCSAGPGVLNWFADIRMQGLDALFFPPKEYGRALEEWNYQWYSGNYLVGMILPQRAFLPGMTLTVWLLCGLQAARTRKHWLLLGLGAGCMPIVHMHSSLALLVFGAALLWPHRSRWREWSLAFVPGALLAIILYASFLHSTTPYPNFVQLQIGYQASNLLDWLLMWWRFWGFALPATLLGWFFLPKGSSRRIILAAAMLFLIANLVLFQPIAWDNSKVFLWAYFGFCGAMTSLVALLWRQSKSGKILSGLLLLLLTLTGIAELLRLTHTQHNLAQVISATDLRLAERIHAETPAGSRFLTSMDIANAALWAGRPIFLGFGGWMSNFGFDHTEREADLKTMFAGIENAKKLLEKYHIDYVMIGPGERYNWQVNENWYKKNYPLVIQVEDRSVYQIKNMLTSYP